MQRIVSYLRVSTDRQGRSGLGIEAQREAVSRHLAASGGVLAAEVVEVESGKRADRPRLSEALRLCRVHGATLIIARIDRLARNVAFVSALMEAGVEFTAVDFPTANRLTVHILAAVAEHEAKAISDRTKAALAAARARGVVLGNPDNLRNGAIGRDRAAAGRTARAAARAADLSPILAEIRAAGIVSLGGLARELNARAIPTARGGAWGAEQVKRVLAAR